ncbi:hypothetical protein FRC07_002442, partial [Ceratobasidium sp. 392]
MPPYSIPVSTTTKPRLGQRWAVYQTTQGQTSLEALNNWKVLANADITWDMGFYRASDNTAIHTATPI